MRYLLDKNIVRHCLRGLLLGNVSHEVRLSISLLQRIPHESLYISPETHHILLHIIKVPQAHRLANYLQVLYPVRYTKRWARRLRQHSFGREDAYLLSLATFGTNSEGSILGVHALLTFDMRFIEHFANQKPILHQRLRRMTSHLSLPYTHAVLPSVLTPDDVLPPLP